MISLTTILVILKGVLVIVALPIVIWFYTEKGKDKCKYPQKLDH